MSRKLGRRRAPLRPAAARDIEIAVHIALERLIRGGDRQSLYVMLQSFSVAYGLSKADTPEREKIQLGMAALINVGVRARKTGTYRLVSHEVGWACEALLAYDAQLETASSETVAKIVREMDERVKRDPLEIRRAA